MGFAIWTAIILFIYFNCIEAIENENDNEKLKAIMDQLKELRETNEKLNERLEKLSTKTPMETRSTSANWAQSLPLGGRRSGIYRIQVSNSNLGSFYVNCLADPGGGGGAGAGSGRAWALVLRRMEGGVDFKRSWQDYQRGFGNLNGDFFLGLEKIHALTQSTPHELWIELGDFDGERCSANYTTFAIGNSTESYALKTLGDFSATSSSVGDSFTYHAGMKFSTRDMNDEMGCAQAYHAGWWYNQCFKSYLTGIYFNATYDGNDIARGIRWNSWRGDKYSLKYAHMAIRPVQ